MQTPQLWYVNVFVGDLERAIRFYGETLGLELQHDDREFGYASFAAGPVRLGVAAVPPESAEAEQAGLVGRHTGVGLGVADLEAAHRELRERGVHFPMPPEKQPWGGFMAVFADSDGNLFYLDQLRGEQSSARNAAAEESDRVGWAALERTAPDFAAAGRRLLVGDDGVSIAFLATVGARGAPHLAPVCPIFCGEHLYLSAGARTPKARDLRERGAFTLHAFLGENDEELQLSGAAAEVDDPTERAAVHAAIPFAAFERSDPVFRLAFERALWVYWERVGQPDTRAVRRRWRSGPSR